MSGVVLTSTRRRADEQVVQPSFDFIAEVHATEARADALEGVLQSSAQAPWADAVNAKGFLQDFQDKISDAVCSVSQMAVAPHVATAALKSTISSFLSKQTRRAREGLFNLVKTTNSSITAVGGKFHDALIFAAQRSDTVPQHKIEMQSAAQKLIDHGICHPKANHSTTVKSSPRLNLLEGLKSFFFHSEPAAPANIKGQAGVNDNSAAAAIERLRKNQLQLEHNAKFELDLLGQRDRDGKRIGRGRIQEELELIDMATLAGQAAAKRLFHNYSDLLIQHSDMFWSIQRAKKDLERTLGIPQGDEPAAPLTWETSIEQLREIMLQSGAKL